MKFLVVLSFAVFAVATAFPYEVAEDEEGGQYYLVPVSRERRQTKWGVSNSGVGVSHQGTILNNNNHRLDGSAYAAKNFGSHGLRPDQAGGRLDYSHKPSGSGAFIGADNARRYGTDVNAGVSHNLYQGKNFGVDANAYYGRHFGGPSGTGRPASGAGIVAHGRF